MTLITKKNKMLNKSTFAIALMGIWMGGVCASFFNPDIPEPQEPVSTLERILDAGEITVINEIHDYPPVDRASFEMPDKK